tara:strand:- start:17783 stop:18967 length:1185 start_codon:yes stop_codon:yes gene_type:complete
MNFTFINKFIFLFIISFVLTSCSTKTLYESVKLKKYEKPIIENFDQSKIILNESYLKKINYNNKITLKGLREKNQNNYSAVIKNEEIFKITNEKKFLKFDSKNGELLSSSQLDLEIDDEDQIISFQYLDDSFVVAFKSGIIFKINSSGEIIWVHEENKILNTPFTIHNEQIILLYVDEIKSVSSITGYEIWSKTYEDIPVYQANGGQLANFFNLLFFILPNNKIGSVDINLGTTHPSDFNNLSLISSFNNAKDKIHIYNNLLSYLDEGKYLYTYDIFKDNFLFSKKNINKSTSNNFFNNSLILKEGNYLQAINILNGNTFWLISDKKISKKASIIKIRSIENYIEIFLNNGDVLEINGDKLTEIYNLDVGKINNISFSKHNIIVNTEKGETVIF